MLAPAAAARVARPAPATVRAAVGAPAAALPSSDAAMSTPAESVPATVALPPDAARLLDEALRALLAPLTHDSVLAWRDAIRPPLMALAASDTLGVHLPFLPLPAQWHAPHLTPAWLDEFVRDFQHRDLVSERIEARRLEVAHQWDVVDPPTLHASAIYNELQRPHRLFNTVHITTPIDGGEVARFWLTRERERTDAPDPGRMAMLRLVAPALRAGIGAWRRLGSQRAALSSLLDRLADGALLFDLAGVPVHANARAERLLADDPEAARVRAAAQQAAWTLGATRRRSVRADAAAGARQAGAASRELRTRRRAYRLEATVADDGLFGRDPTVLVLVQPVAAEPPSDDALRARYGLTRQEVVVARLIAEGLADGEIAGRLGVAHATARNHSARVLQKLGVGKRTRVAPLLAGGDA